MISIWMFRIGGSSIWELPELIFKSSIENGTFPSDWKKADVALAHKKLPRTTITTTINNCQETTAQFLYYLFVVEKFLKI